MITDFLLLIGSIIFVSTLWHFVYSWYKEREWKQNNPEDPWSNP